MRRAEKPKAPPTSPTPEEQKARERGLERLKDLARNALPVRKQPFPKLPVVN